jgi:hypothetical protein
LAGAVDVSDEVVVAEVSGAWSSPPTKTYAAPATTMTAARTMMMSRVFIGFLSFI